MSITYNPQILVDATQGNCIPVHVSGELGWELGGGGGGFCSKQEFGNRPSWSWWLDHSLGLPSDHASFPLWLTVLLPIAVMSSLWEDLISITYIFVLTWGKVNATWNETMDSSLLRLYQNHAPLKYLKGESQENNRHQKYHRNLWGIWHVRLSFLVLRYRTWTLV